MPTAAPGKQAAILVVDDDPTVRRAIGLVLEDRFETVEADCAAGALRLARERRFDAVLLDMMLPDVDGLEVLRQLRRLDAAPPVVVVTGVTVLRTAVEAMKLGAVDYVSKPFAVDDLLAAVGRALGAARRIPDGANAVRAPVAVVGGEPPAQASLALLVGQVAPVERFPPGTRTLPTREVACAIVLAGLGGDPGAAAGLVDHLVARTPVFLLAAETTAGARGSRGVLASADWSTLVTAVRRHLAPGAVALGRPVAQAVSYMTTHHGRALNVGDIAAAVNVSESHLAHLFPAETGYTVRGFLRALRLELAREQIAAGADKLDTIARRLRFADGPHLARALRRATVPWPDAWRRRA